MVAKRSISRRERCGTIRSAALRSPLFGGARGRSLRAVYKLSRRARISVAVLRGKRVVARLSARTRAAGTRRFTVPASAVSRGAYTVRIVARAGRSRSVVRLAARRL